MAGFKNSTEYTISYKDFRGVMLGGSRDKSRDRLAYSENLWRDYSADSSGVIESVPGFRRLAKLEGVIHSLVIQRVSEGEEYLLIHAGTGLYRMSLAERNSFSPTEPIATLDDKPCTHFTHGTYIYYLSDGGMIRIDGNGLATRVGDGDALPYIPTIERNGEMHEQLNLLSTMAKHEFVVSDPTQYPYGSPGLKYSVIDRELGTCRVIGMNPEHEGALYVPSATMINGRKFRVTEISKKAFSFCTLATEIYVSDGIEVIGDFAFNFCKRAKKIVLPRTVRTVGIAAFENCQEMTDLYLGADLESIHPSQFVECTALQTIHYGGGEEIFETIEGIECTENYVKIFRDEDRTLAIALPINGDSSVTEVKSGSSTLSFEELEGDDGSRIVFTTTTLKDDEPSIITVSVSLGQRKYEFGAAGVELTGCEAIYGCRIAEAYDGRVFLSGNPMLPNTVFYSSIERDGRNSELYFGAMNYFHDGQGSFPVRALLAAGGSLAVFKAGDAGDGSIFYHTPSDTGEDYIPRIYPRTYVHSGIAATGGAVSFLDDPVFLTKSGLYSLAKPTINLERSVVCRSHNVNFDLLREDLSSAIITEWCGYLVIITGTRAYLADSRATFRHETGGTEYEWFIIDGMGSYSGDESVYRFDSYATRMSEAHPNAGEEFFGTPCSFVDEDGVTYYYGEADGKSYTLYKTPEKRGGELSPVTSAIGYGDLLFFGTSGGVLCIFNNDMRGVPPASLSEKADFDPEEYSALMSRKMHPEFYSFDNHRVRYALRTVLDNCGIPHLTKSTVKHSLVVKCTSNSAARLRVEVGTEGSDFEEITSFPGSTLSFREFNFESLCLSTSDTHTLPIGERERGWVEKEIAIYSDGYASPIGIHAIAYRFTIKGRVKKS